jgi:hypothetical protein
MQPAKSRQRDRRRRKQRHRPPRHEPHALSNRASRSFHLNFEVDLDDWVGWALKHDVMTEVIAFLRFRPDLPHKFDAVKNDKAFPTPRPWESSSQTLGWTPESSRGRIRPELLRAALYLPARLSETGGDHGAREVVANLPPRKRCRPARTEG